MHGRPRILFARQPAVWAGLSILGVLLLAVSGFSLRSSTAHATPPDTTCTSASYKTDVSTLPLFTAITFDCPTATTINVTTGAGGPGMVLVDTAETLSITSIGAPVTLSGEGTTQLFQVYFGTGGAGTLNLSNITLTGGSASNNLGTNTNIGGAIYDDGNLTITACTFTGNTAIAGGGAIYEDDYGSVTISGSAFTKNTAAGGYVSEGGAIANNGGSLGISDTAFTGNAATGHLGDASDTYQGYPGDGGAIYSAGNGPPPAILTISGSTFTSNTATGGDGGQGGSGGPAAGGAVDAPSGELTIADSTFSQNSATAGNGGVSGNTSVAGADGGDAGGGAVSAVPYNLGDSVTVSISNSTFVGNTSTAGGGGASGMIAAPGALSPHTTVYGNGGSSFGGALNTSGGGVGAIADSVHPSTSGGGVGAVKVVSSTFTSNTSTGGSGGTTGSGYGGALNASGGGVGAIAGLTGHTITVSSTLAENIIFDNLASTSDNNCALDLTAIDGGYNLTNTGDTGCRFSAASPYDDVFTPNAGLGTYGNNGGPAPTIYLTKTSAALDVIPSGVDGCGVTGEDDFDERGVPRPQNGKCDIGAYELAPDSVTHLTASPSTVTQGQSVQLCATVVGKVAHTGTPTGTVTFLDGSSAIGSGTLSGGTVCISTSTLGVGSHSITASYGGDPQFNASVSSAVTVTVGVYGADVAGAPGSGNAGAPPSANTGATGNSSGAGASGQQSQSAASSGSGVVASSTATGTQPGVSGIWPAGLGLGLGALLLLVGLGGLGMVLVRAAKR